MLKTEKGICEQKDFSEKYIRNYYDLLYKSDKHQNFFHHSGFSNYGYWEENEEDPVNAGKVLVEKILEPIPVKTGLTLDVACGCGGTTNYLTHFFNPSDITGINISEYQVKMAQKNNPSIQFLQMNATELQFPGNSFMNVICVEAAFHFYTREKFFNEVYRVLKPGGYLVLSDIIFNNGLLTLLSEISFWNIFRKSLKANGESLPVIPADNRINLNEYIEILKKIGFVNIQIKPVIDKTWKRHYKKTINLIFNSMYKKLDFQILKELIFKIVQNILFSQYILVAAQK